MARTILSCLVAAAALGGCAVQSPHARPEPEIIVYTGLSKDPRYQVPAKYRDAARIGEREARARFQQEAQAVHERVRRDPAFGGFVLRWEPEPHALVMFTGNAEARLRRYTHDVRFRAQRVELTLTELERMRDAFGAELSRLRLTCFTVDGDEVRNAVTVTAPAAELAKVRTAIAAGQVRAPPKLRLDEQGCPTFR